MAEQDEQENPAPEVRVVTTGKSLKIGPFKIPDHHLEIGRAWEEWLEDFEEELSYFEIDEIQDRVSALKIYGGQEVKRLARNLPDPAPVVGDNEYKKLKRKLGNHFLPKKNKHHARYTFNKQKMEQGESITTYTARMREKARDCEFGDQTDDRILEHLVQTVKDDDLIKKCIQKRWNLDQFIDEASQREDIGQQVKDMKEEFKVAKIHQRTPNHPRSHRKGNAATRFQHKQRKPEDKQQARQGGKHCDYCGRADTHKPGQNCPAYGKQCLKCGKYNHIAVCCKGGQQLQQGKQKPKHRRHVRKTMNAEEMSSEPDTESSESDSESSESDSDYLHQTAQHVTHHVKRVRSGANQDTVMIRIGDIDAHVEPDSGASANIMDEYQFKALRHRSQEILNLETSDDTLKTLQSSLIVQGEFPVTLRNANRGIRSKFLVIQGKMDSPPLLCKKTLIELGMLKIEPQGTLKDPNELKIKAVKPAQDKLEALLHEYSDVFEGIGCIRDKNTGKEIEVKLEMDPEAIPTAQKPRHVAYHLQKPLKEWLDQGIEQQIFEKVPDGEPITWCSPLVVQPKPKYTNVEKEKLQSQMIRASIDMRIPNQSMKRSRCVQPPRVEDFTYDLHDCKIFTKLDLRQGYHQLTLDPETRQIATFSTPWGNYRPKRLVFGAKSSQDVFDEAMFRIFGDIPHCVSTSEMTFSLEGETTQNTSKFSELSYNERRTTE